MFDNNKIDEVDAFSFIEQIDRIAEAFNKNNKFSFKFKPTEEMEEMSSNYEPQTTAQVKIRDLEEQLHEARKENDSLKNYIDKHMSQVSALEAENKSLKEALNVSEREKKDMRYMHMAEMQRLEKEAKEPSEELKDRLKNQEQEISRLRTIRDAYEFCITNLGCKK